MAKVFYFMFSLAGGGNHFENRAVEKLAVTFERGIGAKFSLKWSTLANQSRKKGRKRMVTGPIKMTLLYSTWIALWLRIRNLTTEVGPIFYGPESMPQ